MKTPDGKSIRDMVANDPSPSTSAPTPAPAAPAPSGRVSRLAEAPAPSSTEQGAAPVAGAPDAGGKREHFMELDGKRFKVEIGEDGRVISKEVEGILRDPNDYYNRFHKSSYDKQVARERDKIRREELADLHRKLEEVTKLLPAGQQQAAAAAPAAPAAEPHPDKVDWSKIDMNDPAQVLAGMQQEAEIRAEKKAQATRDMITERDRYEANELTRETYAAWNEYDPENGFSLFSQVLRDEGVEVGEGGPNYQKSKPWEVKSAMQRAAKKLAWLKETEARIERSIGKAVALMGVEFDDHLVELVKAGFRNNMKTRPFETDRDCETIAYDVAKQVLKTDSERILSRADAYRKAFEANKGGSQKVETDKTEPTVDNRSDLGKLSHDERHRLIRERGARDKTV